MAGLLGLEFATAVPRKTIRMTLHAAEIERTVPLVETSRDLGRGTHNGGTIAAVVLQQGLYGPEHRVRWRVETYLAKERVNE